MADSAKTTQEWITPYKVYLLHIIYYHQNTSLPVISLQSRRKFCQILLEAVQNQDQPFDYLTSQLENIESWMKEKFIDLFTQQLAEEQSTAIVSLMERMEKFILHTTSATFHRASVLGIFARRVVLAFNQLLFSDVVRLYDRIVLFGHSHYEVDASVSQVTDDFDQSLKLNGREDAKSDCPAGFSDKQGHFFLSKQLAYLAFKESEALPGKVLESTIISMVRVNPEMASAFYVAYLNSTRMHDLPNALRFLHLYFDNPEIVLNNMRGEAKDFLRSYRYAALNLAILQCRFGNWDNALQAIVECLNLAYEANDATCLQYAFFYYFKVTEALDMEDPSLLCLSVMKAKLLGELGLSSIGVQMYVHRRLKLDMTPLAAFDFLSQSDNLNSQYAIPEVAMISTSHQAALWSVFGRPALTAIISQVILLRSSIICYKGYPFQMDAETSCIALCNLAEIEASRGNMDVAYTLIDIAEKRFHNTHASLWQLTKRNITFEYNLRTGRLDDAEAVLTVPDKKSDCGFRYNQALLHLARGECERAHSLLRKLLIDTEHMKNEPEVRTRVLIAIADVSAQSGNQGVAMQYLVEAERYARERHQELLMSLASIRLAFLTYLRGDLRHAMFWIRQPLVTVNASGCLYDSICANVIFLQIHLSRLGFPVSTRDGLCAKPLDGCEPEVLSRDGWGVPVDALQYAEGVLRRSVDGLLKLEALPRLRSVYYLLATLLSRCAGSDSVLKRNQFSWEFRQLDERMVPDIPAPLGF